MFDLLQYLTLHRLLTPIHQNKLQPQAKYIMHTDSTYCAQSLDGKIHIFLDQSRNSTDY